MRALTRRLVLVALLASAATASAQDPDRPRISNLEVRPTGFSPDGDGVNDSTTIAFVLADTAGSPSFAVSVRVRDCAGALLKVIASGPRPAGAVRLTWDGRGTGGLPVPDGFHLVEVTAANAAGPATAVATVRVDTRSPSIVAFDLDHDPFSPNGDGLLDELRIRIQPFDALILDCARDTLDFDVRIDVRDLEDRTLERFVGVVPSGVDTALVAIWDGEGAAEGLQLVVITAEDDGHNVVEQTALVDVDRLPPAARFDGVGDTLALAAPQPIALRARAADRNGVLAVDVSFDGGTTWTPAAVPVPADSVEAALPPFVPPGEGTFELLLRAADPVGNLSGRTTAPPADALVVVIDGTAPVHAGTLPAGSGFYADGDTVVLASRWDAAGYVIAADFSLLDSEFGRRRGEVVVEDLGGGEYAVRYPLSPHNQLPDATGIPVAVAATDLLGRRSEALVRLGLDNTAPVAGGTVRVGTGAGDPVRNGDTVELETRWDQAGYQVTADFSGLDSGYQPGAERVTDLGGGAYAVSYTLTHRNARSDTAGVAIPVEAADLAGNAALDRSLLLELRNGAVLELALVRSLDPDRVVRDGDEIRILTTWTGPTAGLAVSADFGALDSEFAPGGETLLSLGDGSFEIRYVLALANRRPDGAALPIRVRGETAARAVADSSLTYALDNTPPPAPVLEPLPATVTASAVEVRGTAAGAAAALVELDGRAAGEAAVGAGGAFRLGLELSAGSHSVAVRARDAAGNVGPPATASIELLAGFVVRAPRPFRPGSSFLVAPGRAAERVEIRVFNLAAEEVAYLDAAGPADRFEIPWRAVNDDGHEVRSGAFLCRVRLDFAGGESQVHHLPIVVVR